MDLNDKWHLESHVWIDIWQTFLSSGYKVWSFGNAAMIYWDLRYLYIKKKL